MKLTSSPVAAFGPLRTFRSLCFAGTGGVPTCRVPARRPGNFHLLVQMKATKAKDLNAKPFTRSARFGTPARRATWRTCGASSPQRARGCGLRKASPAQIRWTPGRREARPRRARCRLDLRRTVKVARRAGCAKREERAEWFCIQPLCFGDFHLGPQMKVTRPPGRDPAGWHAVNTAETHNLTKISDGPKAAYCTPARFMRRGSRDTRWGN